MLTVGVAPTAAVFFVLLVVVVCIALAVVAPLRRQTISATNRIVVVGVLIVPLVTVTAGIVEVVMTVSAVISNSYSSGVEALIADVVQAGTTATNGLPCSPQPVP